jgi:hypothetical protein
MFDGSQRSPQKEGDNMRASPTMRRATPPVTVGVAGSHCVCGQRGRRDCLASDTV